MPISTNILNHRLFFFQEAIDYFSNFFGGYNNCNSHIYWHAFYSIIRHNPILCHIHCIKMTMH